MTISSAALDLLAVCAPLTGTRATGVVRMVGDDTPVPRNTVIIPLIDGRAWTSMRFKVAAGPNDDESWTAVAGGTDIGVFSNIGGARHNLPDGTEFTIHPPTLSGITSIVANGAFENGTDRTGWGAVKDAVVYDHVDGPAFHIDIARSELKGFPGLVVAWAGSDPADGGTITTKRRTSKGTTTFREQFVIAIIVNRAESAATRREEALAILQEASEWLTSRSSVDGRVFSGPDGCFIQRRLRELLPKEQYQKFAIYSIVATVQQTLSRRDTRVWNDWLTSVIDMVQPQDPALPNQGDFTVVDDMTVDMEQS